MAHNTQVLASAFFSGNGEQITYINVNVFEKLYTFWKKKANFIYKLQYKKVIIPLFFAKTEIQLHVTLNLWLF